MSDFSVNNVNFFNEIKPATKNENKKLYLKDLDYDSFEYSTKNQTENKTKRGIFNRFIDKITGYKTECTDGKDDGKLSFKEKIGSLARGCLNMVTNFVDSIIEHPVKSTLTLGATVLGCAALVSAGIISAPVLAIGGSAIGLAFGAFKIGQGIVKANKATNDFDAKTAYESIGEGTANVAVSALTMRTGIKNLKEIKKISNEAAQYSQEARKSADTAGDYLKKAEESAKSAKDSQQIINNTAQDANKVYNETCKISEGTKAFQKDISESGQRLQNITETAKSASSDTKTIDSLLEKTKILADDAEKYAITAEKAAKAARKSSTVRQAIKHRDIAKESAKGAKMAAEATEESVSVISGHSEVLNNYSQSVQTELNKMYDTLKKVDTAVSHTDYGSVPYEDDRIFAYDGYGAEARTDLRTKMYENYGLLDENLQVKPLTPAQTNDPAVSQLSANSRFSELGALKTKKNGYVFENLKDAPDGQGLRGKTPLAGKPKDFEFRIKRLQKSGIKRIIDFRAEGECSNKSRTFLSELGVDYVNFPIEDSNWSLEAFPKMKAYFDAVNAGDFYAGCANGQARTDLAMAINYLFNPKAKNIPDFYYGSASSSRVSIKKNIQQILELIKQNPDTVKDFGWQDYTQFEQEFSGRFAQIISSLSK